MIETRFLPRSIQERSDFEKTICAVIYSSMIIFINLILMKLMRYTDISTFESLQNKLGNISFFIKYIILTIFSSILFVGLKNIFDITMLYLVNKVRKIRNLPQETKFTTIWDEIFENKDVDLSNMFVTVEKDGQILSQGALKTHSSPDIDNRELLLSGTNFFKEYLDSDNLLNEDQRLLDIIDKEYVNLSNGIVIKFYNTEKLMSYLNEE